MDVRLEPSWKKILEDQFSMPYFSTLSQFVHDEYSKQTIYPSPKNIFFALDTLPFDQVKVVILGQDPYHGPDQAHGLSFSVQDGVKIPPSLVNIYKELHSDLGIPPKDTGNLSNWASQGVLLLNATLTVRAHQAGSHQNKGWEQFTDAVIHELANKRKNLVFILWGNYAQKKGDFINSSDHLIIKSPHPSPLSAHNGFFGSKPFSQTNNYLIEHNQSPINW